MNLYDKLLADGTLKQRQVEVYVVLFSNRKKYPDGMTAREINEWLKTKMYCQHGGHSGVHSRLRELEKIGLVKYAGKRRDRERNANVWICI